MSVSLHLAAKRAYDSLGPAGQKALEKHWTIIGGVTRHFPDWPGAKELTLRFLAAMEPYVDRYDPYACYAGGSSRKRYCQTPSPRSHVQVVRSLIRGFYRPCRVCGRGGSQAHHIDPASKKFNILHAFGSPNLVTEDEVREELSKCVCLCSDCHQKVHAGRIILDKEGKAQ